MKIGGILLAAGGSTRLGQPKQLLELDGQTLVEIAIDQMTEAIADTITVVTGGSAIKVTEILKRKNVSIAQNHNWKSGMASSIKIGLKDLLGRTKDIEAVLICLCDQPFLTAKHLKKLIEISEKETAQIIASNYHDLDGVPAIFKKSTFSDLLNLEGHQGARKVIRKESYEVATLPFSDGVFDVDTLDDWKKIQEIYRRKNC